LSSYNSPPKVFTKIYYWKYLLNLKFGRARLGAIECFEWKFSKLTTKHKKIMQNISNLTIFLDVGARN
jgi:hypothetical protein